MSPFSFNNAGTNDRTTFDFDDLSKVRHDWRVGAAPDAQVNVHVITKDLNRHMFVLTRDEFHRMFKWLVHNRAPDEMTEQLPLVAAEQPAVDIIEVHHVTGQATQVARTPATHVSVDLEAQPRLGKPLPLGVRECLDDLISHSGMFAEALRARKRLAELRASHGGRVEPDTSGQDDASYWQHEIDVHERMVQQARDALAGRQA